MSPISSSESRTSERVDRQDDCAATSAPDRYRCSDYLRLDVGKGFELVQAKAGPPAIIPARTAKLLARCSTFKTLDAHAQDYVVGATTPNQDTQDPSSTRHGHRLIRRLARILNWSSESEGRLTDFDRTAIPESRESIRAQLQTLVDAGLLLSEQEFVEHYKKVQVGSAPEKIKSVGIVTCGRPESLRCSVTSYLENAKRHGRVVDFVVVDDSKDSFIRDRNQQTLRSLRDYFGVEIVYAGLEQKSSFARELATWDRRPVPIATR